MKTNNKEKGFTLVELIVVITILAILGTISFMAMQSYTQTARNSVRIADLSRIKSSLELFNIDSGKYPLTTGGFSINYSGSLAWNQGIFGNDTFNNVDKIDKIPVDPLTGKEYTYSLSNTKQEYQLSGIFEGDQIALNNILLNATYAGDKISTAIVTGNYNGVLFKSMTGTHCEVLSVPSIISSMSETETNLVNIITNGGLVYNGYKNLPSNYINSKYKTNGGFAFNPSNIVAYSDNESCEPLFSGTDNTARKQLIEGLQNSYSGTIIENEEIFTHIINIDTNDDSQISSVGNALVNNSLGGNLEVTSSNSSGGGETPEGENDLIEIVFINADNESYTCDLCD